MYGDLRNESNVEGSARLLSMHKRTVVVALGLTPEALEYLVERMEREATVSRFLTVGLGSQRARRNFVRLLYGHESWWDERRANHFASRAGKQDVCVLECWVVPEMDLFAWKNSLRQELRTWEKCDFNGHLHVPDSDQEVQWILGFLAHKDARNWLENGPDLVSRKVRDALREWAIELRQYPNPGELVLTAGMVLKVHGIVGRKVKDLDFVSRGPLRRQIPNISFDLHSGKDWLLTNEESDFDSVFCYKMFTMLSLEVLKRQKQRRFHIRGLRKDHKDLENLLGALKTDRADKVCGILFQKAKSLGNEFSFWVTMRLQSRRVRFHLDP